MELTLLRYFYETAQLEHVTKAADNLHIAQPALSKAIKSLEEELGVSLFYKVGRGVKLTEYGEFLKERAERILREADLLPLEIKKLADLSEKTVSLNVLAASTIITDVIIKFKKANPDAIFKMTQKEGEKADVTVLTNGTAGTSISGVDKHAVIEERIFVAVPSDYDYSENEEIDLNELRFENFICLSGSRRFRPLTDAFCLYAGFKPQVAFESDSLIAVKNLISAGVGVAFWPEFSWGSLNHKNIKLITPKNPACQREIVVIRSETRKSALCDEFFDFLVKELYSARRRSE